MARRMCVHVPVCSGSHPAAAGAAALWRAQVYQRLGLAFRLLKPVHPDDKAIDEDKVAHQPNCWQRML